MSLWPGRAHLQKNRLKRPEIKQGTTSKVNCILFNRLLNPVLLNKSGLVRAKASNFNLKSLNRCFSNYYQVQTMHIFAEPVTYMVEILRYKLHHPFSHRLQRCYYSITGMFILLESVFWFKVIVGMLCRCIILKLGIFHINLYYVFTHMYVTT